MPFSEKKFRNLPLKNRAKKLADLLARVLGGELSALGEYRVLLQWMDDLPPHISIAGDNPDLETREALTEQYLRLREIAGLGPEANVWTPGEADLDRARGETLEWEVLLYNIRSGYNVGAILRTADCLGFQGVRLCGYTPGPDNAAVRSAAMGAEAWVNAPSFPGWREALAGEDRPLIALETGPGSQDIRRFDWPEKGILALGNEELGVPREILERAEAIVSIPLQGRKASLNVSQAFAIAAWEIRRFREKKKEASV